MIHKWCSRILLQQTDDLLVFGVLFILVKLPKDVSFEDAAATIGDGVRAYTALFYHGHLCAGDTVLIVDGASNAGALMIQLATLWGAKVGGYDIEGSARKR